MIVIRENSVNAHVQEGFSFLRVIRPEYVGDNTVCFGLVHHPLVKVALHELKLFASIADGTIHDIPLALAAELPFFRG